VGSGTLRVAGNFVQCGATNAMFRGNLVFGSRVRIHRFSAGAIDQGARMAGFVNNGSFAVVEIAGVVAVGPAGVRVESWPVRASLKLAPGGRFYYLDDSEWHGTVSLEGGELTRVRAAFSSVERQPEDAIRLVWETGAGLTTIVNWTDDLATGQFTVADRVVASGNTASWTDVGGHEPAASEDQRCPVLPVQHATLIDVGHWGEGQAVSGARSGCCEPTAEQQTCEVLASSSVRPSAVG